MPWRPFAAALLLVFAARGWTQTDLYPGVAAAYLVQARGKTLWTANADLRLPPASLTKIMTALLVLDAYQPRAIVTVSQTATKETGTRLGLKAGERMTVADLLAAALLQSANDACHALAEWHAGSEAKFVAAMNARAAQLGLANTRFVNACGHDGGGHYSTARDLAALTQAALLHPEFARLVAQSRLRIETIGGEHAYELVNTNALLGRLPGAAGVKSGYTRRAGKCLIALAERAGTRVLLVFLNAPNRWWDAHAMIERAFAMAGPAR
jgi:D-alanyl-D-alanine carboxypeptidase (penicillin-binding protein 5/6)